MQRKCLSLSFCIATVLSIYVLGAFGQDQREQPKPHFTAIPLRGNTVENVLRESEAGATIPLWTYVTTTNVDNVLYTGQIMGGAPYTGTTTIPTYLVPLIVNMPDGGVFNPTAPDNCAGGRVPLILTQLSPLFQKSGPFLYGNPPVNVGTTQYIDALQRSEFYRLVTLNALTNQWHTLFGLGTTTTQTVNVPQGMGATYNASCGFVGVVDMTWFNNYVTGTLIPSLAGQGVQPTTFPVILMSNVFEGPNGDQLMGPGCCNLGYHSAYGSPMQVYAVTEFDTNGYYAGLFPDILVASHELGEAMNDPTVTNATPAWGFLGQVMGCKSTFEVGDPLTPTQNPPIILNGYTYHPQELAMYSWFFRPNTMQFPFPVAGDLGVPTWYSTNGNFLTTQGVLPTFVMAWKGANNDQGIYWASSCDGQSWSDQMHNPNFGTSDSPALAVFNNVLYMAWKGANNDQGIYWASTSDGRDWSNQMHDPRFGSSDNPALAFYDRNPAILPALYMAWKGANNDQGIYSAFTSGGQLWSFLPKNPNFGTSDGPTLAVFNNLLYMAWKGANNDQGIYWAYSDGLQWYNQMPAAQFGTSDSPALAAFKNCLYMAWKGANNDQGIYWASTSDGINWSAQMHDDRFGTSDAVALGGTLVAH